MKKFSRNLILILCLNFFSISSFAQMKHPLTFGAMILLGTGQMGNSTDVLERTMSYTPVAFFAGYNFRRFRLGFNYEFSTVGQTDSPSSFGNQNIGGKASDLGLRLDYYDGKQCLGLIYRMSDHYALDKPTFAGTEASYDGISGFSLQYYRQLKKSVGLVFDYSTQDMKSSQSNSNDIKWNRVALGVVFTNFAGNN